LSGVSSTGNSGFKFGSYASALKFVKHGKVIVQEGGYVKVSWLVRVPGLNVDIDGVSMYRE
jgi:hypothetical protein